MRHFVHQLLCNPSSFTALRAAANIAHTAFFRWK